MDLEMPGVNGIDAMIAIRNEFPTAHHHPYDVCGRCSDFTSTESWRSRLSVKSLLRKNLGHNSAAVHCGQKRVPADLATQSLITLRMTL